MRTTYSFLAAALTAAVLLTGCGSNSAPNSVASRTVSSARTALPAVGGSPTYEAVGVAKPAKGATTAATKPAGTAYTGTTEPTPAGTSTAPAGKLEAELIGEKNGVIFGAGTYKAQVLVTNPSDSRLTGSLTVTFMNGEKPSKTAPIIRAVDVPANGEIAIDVEDKRWNTDSAELEITTNSTPAGKLTASVTKTKNGTLLGMGKFVATVEVANPTGATKTGTVVVTFLNKGETVTGGEVRQEVELAPGETETLTFENKKWSTDGVDVVVE